jgi:CYTH domain-containing protein
MENIEIERKFLVTNDEWRGNARAIRISQGYITASKGLTVRVRLKDDLAFLTIKAARDQDSRYEFEYRIPTRDANMMLTELCPLNPIEKTRYEVAADGNTWEIDVFEGVNEGLILAEIELTSASQPFARPNWLGPEVTRDARFYNAYLYQHPFQSWGMSYKDLLIRTTSII